MKVLFIGSADIKGQLNQVVQKQAASFEASEIDIHLYGISGKGSFKYIWHIFKLRKYIMGNHYDIFHAHYALSALTAILAGCKPLIISLMGTDTYGDFNSKGKVKISSYYLILISQIIQRFASHIIVKSKNLYKYSRFKSKTSIIPNGVDILKFEKKEKSIINLTEKSSKILFLGDSTNPRKNIKLAQEALQILLDKGIETNFIAPYPVSSDEVIEYLFSCNVLVLSSFNEGSPNVIKEAMAANCPIVTTDVGDVKWVLGNTQGCYISAFNSEDMARKIECAIEFGGRTNGRKRIIELGLDSKTILKKIEDIYYSLMS